VTKPDKPEPVAPRIRYHIYGIIRKNSDRSVRVPSSYELAKMFKTSRRIAQYELERLVADGVLIGKKRIGTFTNPLSLYSRHVATDAMPLIGVTLGSGDHFTYGHEGAFGLAAAYQTLTELDCFIHDLRLPTKSADAMYRDIVSLKLDGLLWISPSMPYAAGLFERLGRAGIKVVSCGFGVPGGLVRIDYAFDLAARDLRQRFLSENRRRIFLWNTENDPFLAAFHRVIAPDEFEWTVVNPKANAADLAPVEKIFADKRPPDAFLLNFLSAPAVHRLALRYGVDCRQRCRLVSLRDFSRQDDFPGVIVHYNYAGVARQAAQSLAQRVSGRGEPSPADQGEATLSCQNT